MYQLKLSEFRNLRSQDVFPTLILIPWFFPWVKHYWQTIRRNYFFKQQGDVRSWIPSIWLTLPNIVFKHFSCLIHFIIHSLTAVESSDMQALRRFTLFSPTSREPLLVHSFFVFIKSDKTVIDFFQTERLHIRLFLSYKQDNLVSVPDSQTLSYAVIFLDVSSRVMKYFVLIQFRLWPIKNFTTPIFATYLPGFPVKILVSVLCILPWNQMQSNALIHSASSHPAKTVWKNFPKHVSAMHFEISSQSFV